MRFTVPADKQPTVIKKYANRRLYNTGTSTYVTLEDLAEMVKAGEDWAPIDPAAVYKAVTNNYVRGGGDGYAMFRSAANAYDFGPDLADVTAEYLAKMQPYQPFTDGRITRK